MQKTSESYKLFKPDFDFHLTILKDFLLNYKDYSQEDDKIHGKHKYMAQLQRIANNQAKSLEIHLNDLETFVEKDFAVYQGVLKCTKRYMKLLYDVVDTIMPKRSVESKDDVRKT
jgi:DNA replicative helicase MCM subunit Mcm2 (Cdc46/Mcm family)